MLQGASSLACARKGWVNVGNGKIECELCSSCLTFTKSATWTIDGGFNMRFYFSFCFATYCFSFLAIGIYIENRGIVLDLKIGINL